MPRPPRPAPPHLGVSVRRALGASSTTLRTLLPRAEGEGRRVVLCSAASRAPARAGSCASSPARRPSDGALVLYGACDAVVRTPYGPFVEALEQLARTTDPAELRAALGPAGGELVRLLPDLALAVGDLPPPAEADPDTERHRLHTAVTDLLTGVTRAGRCCSCSRTATGRTRRRCCCCATWRGRPDDARVLMLATFRDTEADVPEALSETLADLRRSDDVVRLRLDGLSGDEVAEFVRSAAGGDLGAELRELAGAIHDLTERQPVPGLRAVADAGRDRRGRARRRHAPADAPAGRARQPGERARGRQPAARAAVARRRRDLLELARRRRLGVRARRRARARPDSTRPSCWRALDEAVRSGMIEELPSRRSRLPVHPRARAPGAVRPARRRLRRAELHLRVGEALEGAGRALGTGAGRPRAPLRRRGAAGAPRTRRRVQRPAPRAAAVAALAFDEAATRLRTALELGIEDPRQRAERASSSSASASHRGGKAGGRAGGVHGGGGHRPRAGGRASCSRAQRSASRTRAGGPGIDRPGRGRAARGGGRRRSATSESELRVGLLGRPRPRARLPGRPHARRRRPHERDRDGPAPRRPRRAGHRPDALVLVARDKLARARCSRC